jgi:hypothetical protein
MHVLDAAKATVDRYPGGAESLAPRIGMSAGILRNKVNPNIPTNHLTLAEADQMMSVSNDFQILQAMAQEHGFALTRIGDAAQPGSILSAMLTLEVAGGEFARTIHDAMADNVISENEMRVISKAGHAEQEALILLINRLRAATSKHALASA